MYKIKTFKCRLVKDRSLTLPTIKLDDGDAAAKLFMMLLKDLPHEEVYVAFLSATNEIIGVQKIAQGSISGAALTTMDVFRGACLYNARSIVMAHNHPSGDPRPSPDDILMTEKLVKAGELLGVLLLDHLVVCPARGTWRSCFEPDIHHTIPSNNG